MATPRRRAVARLQTIPSDAPDRRTSLADARVALCLARGVDVDDIHPASGHNLSFAAYERSRQSWLTLIADNGGWTDWTRARCAEAGERWRRRRPEYLDKLPWPGGAA